MKKRILKKWVNDSLTFITICLSVIIFSTEDFDGVQGLLVFVSMIVVFMCNVRILEKYGRKGE